ncbi:MAG: 1-deoxy-D-xylulose-5-phosphate reductoisomerase [Micrococcales bacterium]|nr:MAG: 1-deoxy-D-xylulose-5-phosphate reductoisomerase [Micrococcales bacterium]
MPPTRIVLLGSTGSIGTQALEVIGHNRDRFQVTALAAGGGNVELLARQAVHTGAQVVAVADERVVEDVRAAIAQLAGPGGPAGVHRRARRPVRVIGGPHAVEEAAGMPCDRVVNGMTGSAGLRPTLAALGSGAVLALANKESLIAGGPLVQRAAWAAGGTGPGATDRVVPVDSEHSALAQCLRGGTGDEVARLVLTASGGPFRGWTRAQLADVTPQQALAHPTWSMGPVVTTNSATMVNKALEVLEAHLLFGVGLDRIDVVVHPQSVVHSMVEFLDGSTLAQASPPDMRLPIALGLGWPDRVPGPASPCDWTTAATWEFFPLDDDAFPAVRLARAAGRRGGTFPAVFNAANETCVHAFFGGNLGFVQIVDTLERVVDAWSADPRSDVRDNDMVVDDVLTAQDWAGQCAATFIGGTSPVRT